VLKILSLSNLQNPLQQYSPAHFLIMKLTMSLFLIPVAGVRPPFPTYFTEAEMREHSITPESWWR
jgi:hypothetical protein